MHFLKITAAFFTGFLLSAQVNAQEAFRVAESKIHLGPWTLQPICEEESNGTLGRVVSFLALADVNSLNGNNLVAVWYQRTEDDWSVSSWGTTDPVQAVNAVKAAYGLSDEDDYRWQIAGLGGNTVSAGLSQAYVNGVLAGDPLEGLVQFSPDRDAIVDFLQSVGYQVANIPIEQSDGCSAKNKLDAFSMAIEQSIVGDIDTRLERSMTALIESGISNCSSAVLATTQITYPYQPVPGGVWGPPSFDCSVKTEDAGLGVRWTHCQVWKEALPATQKRTLSRIVPGPPETYQFCDQTISGNVIRTSKCCTSGVLPLQTVPQCPTTPPVPAIGSTCTTTLVVEKDWFNPAPGATWTPPCPF